MAQLHRFQFLVALFIFLLSGACPGATPTSSAENTTGIVPFRGLYHTAEDLVRARAALRSEPWRTRLLDDITSIADPWLRRDDAWIRNILPKPGSLFSYGTSGCPACGGKWKRFGADTCSLDNPGKVVCPHCRRSFPDPDPASPYHDTGKGVTVNGKKYFLLGVWNSFVIQQMYAAFDEPSCALNNLAHAYALTGRDEYAHKAIVMMDALATLTPTTLGPRDFDAEGRTDSRWGRLHFLTSIAYRAQVFLARNYDLVGNHPLLKKDSPTSPGITMAENIRHGLFEEYLFQEFDTRGAKLATLHNHEADTVRAMLVTGLLFGNADYIRWGMEGFDALLGNTIDRDGMYYETSTGYTQFTRSVFADMAEMLANYRPEKYTGLPGSFPPARNYFEEPKLVKLLVDNFDLSIAGHAMNFGNDHTDRSVYLAPVGEFWPWDFMHLGRITIYSPDQALREKARGMMSAHLYRRGRNAGPSRWWLLKIADPLPTAPEQPVELSPVGSGKFFSTKAIAAFQSGEWPDRRGFLVRGGPNLPHAQDDQLGLNLWDVNRELAAELGYGTFDSHLHKGWSTRAISHNLVTVDEDAGLSGTEFFKKTPGASFRSFYDGGGVKFTDADGRAQFPERLPVSKYRRRVAMVDVDTSRSYYVDLFDVSGGSTRDYSLHAPYHDQLLTNALTLEGITPRPVEGAWTLAGLSPEWRNAPWDEPGLSWGERVTQGEYLRKVVPDDGVGPYGWAAPGRGYGFLYNLRGAETAGPWSATWTLEGKDNAFLRANFLPTRPVSAYAANAPDLTGQHLFNYVVCRDSGTSDSRFVVVLEPYRNDRVVKSVQLVETATTGPVKLRVELRDGRVDWVLFDEPGGGEVAVETGREPVRAQAEFAFLRTGSDGAPQEAHMFRGSRLELGGRRLLDGVPSVAGTVSALTPGADGVTVKLEDSGQAGPAAKARLAVFSSLRYTHDTTIQIDPARVTTDGNGLVSIPTGAVAVQSAPVEAVAADGATTSSIPLPLTFIHDHPTRFLDGKMLVDEKNEPRARIRRMAGMKVIIPETDRKLEPGEKLKVADFVPGDRVEFPIGAVWKAEKPEKK